MSEGTAKISGGIVIGAGTGISSIEAVYARPGVCPTPRFAGERCFLAPRQQPYTFSEVWMHQPDYAVRGQVGGGLPCPWCSSRSRRRLDEERLRGAATRMQCGQ